MTYLLLIPAAILLFILYSVWSVWGLEAYYYECLHGDYFCPWDFIDAKTKAYIAGTKEFKEWKWMRVKALWKRK